MSVTYRTSSIALCLLVGLFGSAAASRSNGYLIVRSTDVGANDVVRSSQIGDVTVNAGVIISPESDCQFQRDFRDAALRGDAAASRRSTAAGRELTRNTLTNGTRVYVIRIVAIQCAGYYPNEGIFASGMRPTLAQVRVLEHGSRYFGKTMWIQTSFLRDHSS